MAKVTRGSTSSRRLRQYVPVLVMLDANVILSDPWLKGKAWHVVRHLPPEWGVRFFTSEIAVAEAIAGLRSESMNALPKLLRWRPSAARLGVVGDFDVLREAVDSTVALYADSLDQMLLDMGVEVVQAPEVPAMVLVNRACARQRPFDESGNGFRDTMIWLSALDHVAESGEELLVLISEDKAFRGEGTDEMHGDLLVEAEALAPGKNVRLALRLDQFLFDTASEYAESTAGSQDLATLLDELRGEELRKYISELRSTITDFALDVDLCHFRTPVARVAMHTIHPAQDINFHIEPREFEAEIARFDYAAVCRLLVVPAEGAVVDPADDLDPKFGPHQLLGTRILKFSGTVHLKPDGKPAWGTIDRIEVDLSASSKFLADQSAEDSDGVITPDLMSVEAQIQTEMDLLVALALDRQLRPLQSTIRRLEEELRQVADKLGAVSSPLDLDSEDAHPDKG